MLNEYESPSQFKLLNSWRESIFIVIKVFFYQGSWIVDPIQIPWKYIKTDERLFNLIQASIDNIPSLIYSRVS